MEAVIGECDAILMPVEPAGADQPNHIAVDGQNIAVHATRHLAALVVVSENAIAPYDKSRPAFDRVHTRGNRFGQMPAIPTPTMARRLPLIM
jgi:hypothetical protein